VKPQADFNLVFEARASKMAAVKRRPNTDELKQGAAILPPRKNSKTIDFFFRLENQLK
jgi:hypothetical protein